MKNCSLHVPLKRFKLSLRVENFCFEPKLENAAEIHLGHIKNCNKTGGNFSPYSISCSPSNQSDDNSQKTDNHDFFYSNS
jgi:hypothetical protein